MAIGIYFTHGKFSVDKYDEAIAQLEAAGAGAPAGRTYHVALETDGEINVFDVWESQEAFDAFGATLMPILTELGVDPGTPMVAPVHNVIEG
jgi:quinol monooxygenase YgiN